MKLRPAILTLFTLFGLSQVALAQGPASAQASSSAPVVTVTVTPSGVRAASAAPGDDR